MARKTIVAGNWKMNTEASSASELLTQVLEQVPEVQGDVLVIMAPPYPFLPEAVERASARANGGVMIAAQNCHHEGHGAYTGEVSVPMLASIGVQACIVGHSERRKYHAETDRLVGLKIAALLKHGLLPIYCCGELREDREQGRQQDVVAAQLDQALGGLPKEMLPRLVVAYEPVWAIGTGLSATPEQAQEMHAFIRSHVQTIGGAAAAEIPLLYGGSCKPSNAQGLFDCPDINGGLIGGASLEADQFVELVRIAQHAKADDDAPHRS